MSTYLFGAFDCMFLSCHAHQIYCQMHHTDKHLQHSSTIWPVWLNGWVFIYELSGSGFESSCGHLNLNTIPELISTNSFYNLLTMSKYICSITSFVGFNGTLKIVKNAFSILMLLFFNYHLPAMLLQWFYGSLLNDREVRRSRSLFILAMALQLSVPLNSPNLLT